MMRGLRRAAPLLSGLGLALAAAWAQNITTGNTAVYVGEGRWNWTVFIQAPDDVVRRITCVEYTLHPTFAPVPPVCQAGKGPGFFPLSGNGWGTFVIQIKIQFRDGNAQFLKHRLRFDPPQIPKPLPGLRANNVARKEGTGLWRWTVFLEGPPETLDQIRCVEYTLHPTFPNPVREVCDRGKGKQGFAHTTTGWGTFEIGIRVFLRSGQVQRLSHQLRF